jgi:hypothetical protein
MRKTFDETHITYETEDDTLELMFVVSKDPGEISGRPEDCYPPEYEVESYNWFLNGDEISEDEIPKEMTEMSEKMRRNMDTDEPIDDPNVTIINYFDVGQEDPRDFYPEDEPPYWG